MPGVGTVFVHDIPWKFEEYVAAIGRVGRIGNTGIAKVFFDVNRDVGMACLSTGPSLDSLRTGCSRLVGQSQSQRLCSIPN